MNAQAQAFNGGPWAGTAVYITIDRDVMKRSCTDYGDGALSRQMLSTAP